MERKWINIIFLIFVIISILQPSSSQASSNQCDFYNKVPIAPSIPSLGDWVKISIVCNQVTFKYCSQSDWIPAMVSLAPPIESKRPSYNFQWNPTEPFTTGNDSTLSVVNVDTWFKFSPEPKKRTYFVTGWSCGAITGYATWKYKGYGFSCFGDNSNPAFIKDNIPWCHKYQYSSYNQPAKAANGDPAFQTYVVTAWEVDGKWVAWQICGKYPCPCDWGSIDVPVYPLCEKKHVPVRQVNSILVPGTSNFIPFQSP